MKDAAVQLLLLIAAGLGSWHSANVPDDDEITPLVTRKAG
jgi:hypothetical protein